MIDRVRLRGFKCIEDVEFDKLGEIAVFVGPNGSGKTAILEAVHAIATKGPNGNYDVDGFVDSAKLLRLNQDKLKEPSYAHQDSPRLKADGVGLAATLRDMKTNRTGEFDKVAEALLNVFPTLEDVRTRRVQKSKTDVDYESRRAGGHEVVFDTRGSVDIPAAAVSRGILRVLGILTAIVGEKRPDLILLDDIEQSLHPCALGGLVGVLRRLLEESSDLQIFATSHSPYLVDHLEPGEVWVTNLDDDGFTVARRLDEHPDFERWANEMSLGEFWSHVGEAWVTGTSER